VAGRRDRTEDSLTHRSILFLKMAEEDETFDLKALVRAAGDDYHKKKVAELKGKGVVCRECGNEPDGTFHSVPFVFKSIYLSIEVSNYVVESS
jgi:hypothetical protein